jgi:hypothetical protein
MRGGQDDADAESDAWSQPNAGDLTIDSANLRHPKQTEPRPGIELIRFLRCRICVCFNDDIDVGPKFKADLLAILIGQEIFYSDFPVQLVSLVDADLGLFGFKRRDRLQHLLHFAV